MKPLILNEFFQDSSQEVPSYQIPRTSSILVVPGNTEMQILSMTCLPFLLAIFFLSAVIAFCWNVLSSGTLGPEEGTLCAQRGRGLEESR